MKTLLLRAAKSGVTMAAIAIALAMDTSARADHDSFEYRGQRVGCAGELDMIEALRCLEGAYADHGRDHHHHAVVDAQRKVALATRTVTYWRSARTLRWAEEHLGRYIRSHSLRDLDDAAKYISQALAGEQEYYLATRRGHGHPHADTPHTHGPAIGPAAPPVSGGPHGGFTLRLGRGGIRFGF